MSRGRALEPSKRKMRNLIRDNVNMVKQWWTLNFFEKRHNVSELKWTVVEMIYGENEHQIKRRLLQREVYWIATMEMLAPKGFNECCNFNAYE